MLKKWLRLRWKRFGLKPIQRHDEFMQIWLTLFLVEKLPDSSRYDYVQYSQ
jgi:hypothetical protein